MGNNRNNSHSNELSKIAKSFFDFLLKLIEILKEPIKTTAILFILAFAITGVFLIILIYGLSQLGWGGENAREFVIVFGIIFLPIFFLFLTFIYSHMSERKFNPRYIGNYSTKELHDFENETSQCKISRIKVKVIFDPDTPREARRHKFKKCKYCFQKSKKRKRKKP